MKEKQPDIEFVAEQAPALGKIDAGSVVQALADSKPDAIFNVLFATDMGKFVREGNTRGLFKGREVVGLLTAEPEYLDPLKKEAPVGWTVTGYPWYSINTPEQRAFLAAYQAKYKDYPRLGTIVGYNATQSIAAGLRKTGGNAEDRQAGRSLQGAGGGYAVRAHHLPRAADHQSTMGAYIGKTAYDAVGARGAGELSLCGWEGLPAFR